MNICGDCGVNERELHSLGCDMEICVKCGDQYFVCECEVQDSEREPFIDKPILCVRCGKKNPSLLISSTEEWASVIGKTYSIEDALCDKCYSRIAKLRGIFTEIKNRRMFPAHQKNKGGCVDAPRN